MKFNKKQLDLLGTVLGIVAGILAVFGTYEIVSPKIAGAVGGVATVFLGVIIQRPDQGHPNTEEVEERAKNE